MDAPEKKRMLRYRWYIFAILLSAYFLVYFHRTSTSVIGRAIVNDIGLPISMLALLSSVYFYTYLAMQIPSGILSDRFGPRRSSGSFLLLASCGAFLTSCGDTFAVLVIGKAMIAMGMALVYVPLIKILAVWFRKNEFASLTGVVIAVGNVGAIAAAAPLAMLMDNMSWQSIFLMLGVITLILALLCLIIIRDHPNDAGLPSIESIEEQETAVSGSSSEKIVARESLSIILLHGGRAFWMPTLSYFMVYGSIMIYQGLWMKYYFDSAYSFVLSTAWLVTMVGVGKIISAFALGIVTDRFGISKKNTMILGNVCFLAVWGIIWLYSGSGSYWFWMLMNFLFGLFGGFMTLSFSQVKECFPIAVSGTVVACMNMFLFGGAAVMQSLSYFIISNETLTEYRTLWMIMFACVILAAVFSVLSSENKNKKKVA